MKKYFGTDGVRGVANRELTAALAYRIGRAAGYLLSRQGEHKGLVIGKDTRISGDMLEAALICGICSVGVDVYRLGVMPTPGVAYLTKKLNMGGGAVISASHNSFGDNGIKFFGLGGKKLSDQAEAGMEILIQREEGLPFPKDADIGRVYEVKDGMRQYADYIESFFKFSLRDFKIVVDCANGAVAMLAPSILRELGAEVVPLFAQPDGVNINAQCGSTYPEVLMERVVREGAHIGLAYDGDADRVLAVDEKGELVDGDQIMVIIALALKAQGLLAQNKLVVTVMSNLGLHKALEAAGIEVVETQVGDRYVLEKMEEIGAILGGEQSGHIISLAQNTTGDGLITGLNLLQVMVASGQPLSVLKEQMTVYPQVLVNVPVDDKEAVLQHKKVQAGIRKAAAKLGNRGRILVRPSGTEPLIRVMAEGPEQQELDELITVLARIIADPGESR